MKVRMRTNLGTNDAAALGLKWAECQDGMQVKVPDAVGTHLVSRRMADELPDIEAVPPPTMHAVPPAAMHAVPPTKEAKPEPKPESKPAPLASRGKQSDKHTSHKES